MSDARVPTPPYAIGILLPGAREPIVVSGRTGRLIGWLVQHRARVERVGRGTLMFHLGLGSFKCEIREMFPDQTALREPIPGEPDLAEGAA